MSAWGFFSVNWLYLGSSCILGTYNSHGLIETYNSLNEIKRGMAAPGGPSQGPLGVGAPEKGREGLGLESG